MILQHGSADFDERIMRNYLLTTLAEVANRLHLNTRAEYDYL